MKDTGSILTSIAGIGGRKDITGQRMGTELDGQMGLWEFSKHSAQGTPAAIPEAVLTRYMSLPTHRYWVQVPCCTAKLFNQRIAS